MLGYPKNLYILPFDHRTSFLETFFGPGKKIGPGERKLVCQYKQLIFEAFLSVFKKIKPISAECAVLVDEEFGLNIIKAARRKKITFLLPVEKSGRQFFSFAHGRNFGRVIKSLNPNIAKALVRFHPSFGQDNARQLKKLAALSLWCKKNDFKLMIELLIPPSAADLKRFKNKRISFDRLMRPSITLRAIKEFHRACIEPDVWKIEAMERVSAWPRIIQTIRSGETRKNVGIIMLGRGENFARVKNWMNICPKRELNGFAVGRTVFLRPLIDLHAGKINKKQAIKEIAKNYLELINYWEK